MCVVAKILLEALKVVVMTARGRQKEKALPHQREDRTVIKGTISAKTVNEPSAKLLNFFSTALKPSQIFTRSSTGTLGPLVFSCGYCG